MNLDSESHADLPQLSAIPYSFNMCLDLRAKRFDALCHLYHFYSNSRAV